MYNYKSDENNFYDNINFFHNTFGYDNLISILESRVLKLGSNVEKKRRKLSGGEPMDAIYMNIYFKDLKNLDSVCGLIFSSKLIKDYKLIVNAGWQGQPIVEITNSDKIKNKIKIIRKFLKNPKKILPENLVNSLPKFMLHEVLFFENIPIKDYLIGIANCGFTKKEMKNIEHVLEKNNMSNVKIFYNYPTC
jgi:hypothetical protein